ncbi:MAG: CHAD domain-containing protein [Sulfuricaulis sp.]
MTRTSLLSLTAGPAACRIVLAYLDTARTARQRLTDTSDTEALHDYRVALRRLRSVLRAYRPWLDVVPGKLLRRARTLARATNSARDVEVMIAWLKHEQRNIRVRDRAGSNWLRAYLEQRRAQAYTELAHEIPTEYDQFDGCLRAVLGPMGNSSTEAAPQPLFASVTAELIRECTTSLAEHLAAIQSVDNVEAIHAARIRGKQLRYLLEPLTIEIPSASSAIKRMKKLQDRFGILCDACVHSRLMVQAVEQAGAEQAQRRLAKVLRAMHEGNISGRVLPGLLVLAVRLQSETQRRYAEVERHYLGGRVHRLLRSIESLAETLAGCLT